MPGGRSVKCSGAALPRGESGREARLLYLAVDVLSSGRCVVYREPSGPSGVRIEERPRSPLREGAVTVSMKAASLNHLDLWLVGGAQRVEPPRVLGADGAGVVAESGDPRWKPGDEVVLYPVSCCWQCEQCLAGRQVFCARFGIFGEHTDGTACEFFQVPAPHVYRRAKPCGWWAPAPAAPWRQWSSDGTWEPASWPPAAARPSASGHVSWGPRPPSTRPGSPLWSRRPAAAAWMSSSSTSARRRWTSPSAQSRRAAGSSSAAPPAASRP